MCQVVVTTKHNDDSQYIWESDASSYSIAEDPRGPTLKRGTTVSLYLKEEAYDYLEQDTIRTLIKKYSRFINFNIYLWASSTKTVDEPIEEEVEETPAEEEEKKDEEEDAAVEEDKEEEEKRPTKPPGTGDSVTNLSLSGPVSRLTSRRANTTSSTSRSLRTRTGRSLKLTFFAEGEVS